jgi:hypothetical protein
MRDVRKIAPSPAHVRQLKRLLRRFEQGFAMAYVKALGVERKSARHAPSDTKGR